MENDKAFAIACLGEPLLELNGRHSDPGGARLYLEAHGGDASNVAIAAARQGARTAFLSAVGDDLAGKSFMDLWAREGVDCSAVRVDSERPTGVYFVSHDEAGHHFTYLRRGSAASAYGIDAAAIEILESAKVLFVSGISLAISDQAADAVLEAFAVARRAGASIAFDTNYRPRLWPAARAAAMIRHAMAQSDIVFPGVEDVRALWGMEDADQIADFCLDLGPRVVVLKRGSAGALLATPEKRVVIEAFPCDPLDATGAGDTLCGSFLARYAAGDSLEDAARYAACAAALATTGYGAVPPIPGQDAVRQALAAGRTPL